MKIQSVRQGYFFAFLIVLLILGFIFLLQSQGVIPCPLCLLQRMMLIGLSIIFFIGMIFPFKKRGQFFIGFLGILTSTLGLVFAGRQAWLQHMPPVGNGGCGVSLEYLFNLLPFVDVMKLVWQGGTECSEIGWVFLHLSLAEWSFILFGLFFIFILWQLRRRVKK
ncbi:MAG: disulfide bond formation protein B [Gammaproteobacteria bacterium]|nr:disulfide bond formation protein B [Gammaproteobacteria bacterium]